MGLTNIALASAAAEIRAADRILLSVIAGLQDANVWSGADAQRFQNEWNDLVSSRLESAASRIDSCTFIPYVV